MRLSFSEETGLIRNSVGKIFGRLMQVHTPYIFEWADKGFHEFLLTQGLTKSHLEHIMESQDSASYAAAGRGFYVSLSPFDSHSFGSHLSVLKASEPLTVIELERSQLHHVIKSVDFVKALSEAGIDAVRYRDYQKNWLSLISVDKIQTVLAADKQIFANILKPKFSEKEPIIDRAKMKLGHVFFPSDISGKLQLFQNNPSQISLNDLLYIDKTLPPSARPSVESPEKYVNAISYGLNANVPTAQLKKAILALNYKNQDAPELRPLNEIRSDSERLYGEILKTFDLKDLVIGHQRSGSDWPTIFDGLKTAANNRLIWRQNIPLEKIQSYENFEVALQRILGLTPEIRTGPIRMSFSAEHNYLFVSKAERNSLLSNPLLKIQDHKHQKGDPKHLHKVSVEYWSLDENPVPLKRFLLTALQNEIDRIQPQIRSGQISKDSAEVQNLQARILKELSVLLFNLAHYSNLPYFRDVWSEITGPVGQKPTSLYLLAVSLHPFKDGNGRWARFLIDYLHRHESHRNSLWLPNFDLDLYVPAEKFESLSVQGKLLNAWVRKATDDADFMDRAQKALDLFYEMNPQLSNPTTYIK